MAWDYFADGKRIGGMTILDMQRPTQAKDTTLYRAACRQCGAIYEMTHRQIMDRATKGRETCMGCRRKAAEDAPMLDGVIRAGIHVWWPIKKPGEKMGGRHDASRGSNAWIGQGASDAQI